MSMTQTAQNLAAHVKDTKKKSYAPGKNAGHQDKSIAIMFYLAPAAIACSVIYFYILYAIIGGYAWNKILWLI